MSAVGKLLINLLRKTKYVEGLNQRIHKYEAYNPFPPGHYYSALTNPIEYLTQKKRTPQGIDEIPKEIYIDDQAQVDLLKKFKSYYDELPFGEEKRGTLRYFFNNDFFTYSDAITLYSFIRIFKPKRIIEIGSGFSSALILDTNQVFLENSIELIFIDPNPERLLRLLKENDNVTIIKDKIQNTDISLFQELEAGDFLLIDTSHVIKSGNDVNHIYFNILPVLNKGVKIHVHDVFFPFDYPEKWIVGERRSWNEIFLLRAFLSYNDTFRILFFNDYIQRKQEQFLKKEMPLFLERKSRVCGGLWMEKTK